jgi:hypothetical protein
MNIGQVSSSTDSDGFVYSVTVQPAQTAPTTTVAAEDAGGEPQ